ncbi:MAG: CubicO group peptidase (beta-lactamase class C family) [Planctomycetota bacterium]|jgi:CubicO group peptidase (beta-lactamase class C family)
MSKRSDSLFSLLLVFAIAPSSYSTQQDSPSAKFEAAANSAVESFVQESSPEAVVVAIAISDDDLFAGSYGPAVAGRQRPATTDTSFSAASLAHAFLVTTALQLQAEDKLSHEDRIATYLPDLLPEGCAVRVGELMSHTSGLPDYRDFVTPEELSRGHLTYASLLGKIVEVAPVSQPGECVQINATDSLLLAALLEKISGMPADELLQEFIFDKLGMDNTDYDLDASTSEASAKEPEEGRLAFLPKGMTSTVSDLLLFQRGLLDLTLLASDDLADMNDLVRLSDGSSAGCGLGVKHVQLQDSDGIILGEVDAESAAQVAYFPEYSLIVVVMARVEEADVGDLSYDLARLVIAKPEAQLLDLLLTEEGTRPYLGQYQVGCSTVVINATEGRIVLDEMDEVPLVFHNQGNHLFIASSDPGLRITFEVVENIARSFTLERHGFLTKAVRFRKDR